MRFFEWLRRLLRNELNVVEPFPHVRPDTPIDRSVPFAAERSPGEIESALESLEGVFSWGGYSQSPGQLLSSGVELNNVEMRPLTDEMIADAEDAVRVKLPASYLAILRMQNGGHPYKDTYRPDYCPVCEFFGIAPGHGSRYPIQELPRLMWELFEGYVDDEYYDQWRNTLDYVHPDWGEKPRIPETILLVAPDVHWGIGLNYIRCGRQGEPSVVHVEMEMPYGEPKDVLTELAPDFMTFLRSLYKDSDG